MGIPKRTLFCSFIGINRANLQDELQDSNRLRVDLHHTYIRIVHDGLLFVSRTTIQRLCFDLGDYFIDKIDV